MPDGQSAEDLVVRIEGTSLEARPRPDGSFEIRGVPPGNHTVSAFSANASIGAQVTVSVGSGGAVVAPEIRLRTAGQIAGIVTAFGDGSVPRVCAGAAIVGRPAREIPALAEGAPTLPLGIEDLPPADPEVRLSTTSGADGTYALKGVAPGPYLVTATLEGVGTQEQFTFVEPARTAPVDFLLGNRPEPTMGRLTGKVVARAADGTAQSVAGARIWVNAPCVGVDGGERPPGAAGSSVPGSSGAARPAEPVAPIAPDGCYAGVAVTDAEGNYALAIIQGRWPVECRHPDYLPARQEVELRGTATLDFVLERVPGERPKLEATASVGKETYTWGEPAEFGLAVKNVGTVPVTLSFDGREASFSVWHGERMVWTYGAGWIRPMPMPEPLAPARTTTTLDAVLRPGDTREYRVSWDQRRADGQMVEPGDFVLRGGVLIESPPTDSPLLEAKPVRFRIAR